MIGRYIAGTLLILGGAMIIAPEKASDPSIVGRADTTILVTQADLPPETTALIPLTPVIEQPDVQSQALPEPRVRTVSAALETPTDGRINTTLPVTQIGGIAALAGLEAQPLPTAIVTEAPSTAQTASYDTGPDYRYVSGSRVNVRSGPSTDYRVVSSVIRGDSVEVLDVAGDGWVEIRIVGSEDIGYMAERFLTADNG